MEKFLKDYVKMYAETCEVKLNKTQLQNIVNNLMEEDELWDTVDSFISETIAREVM